MSYMVKDEEFPDGFEGIINAYLVAAAWSTLEPVDIYIVDKDGTRLLRSIEKQPPKTRTLEDGWNDIT